MIREKRTDRVSGLTKVLEFFSRAHECDAANLAKMLKKSNSFPAALTPWSWDKMVKILLGVTMSFFSFFVESGQPGVIRGLWNCQRGGSSGLGIFECSIH